MKTIAPGLVDRIEEELLKSKDLTPLLFRLPYGDGGVKKSPQK